MFYENLITRFIKNNPKAAIFPIIESTIKKDNGFTVDINELADYYGLDLIDTRVAFSQSEKSSSDLTNDGGGPNDSGYALYADEIYNVIISNLLKNKPVNYLDKSTLFSDTTT